MTYCIFKIFTTADLKGSKNVIYDDLKNIVYTSNLETDFSKIKNPKTFLGLLEMVKYQQEQDNISKNNLINTQKVRILNKSEEQKNTG